MTHVPAIQLYTVREATAEDRTGALTRLADMGYGAVEVQDDPAGFRAMPEDLCLTVCGAGAEKRTLAVGSTCNRPALVPLSSEMAAAVRA